MDGEWCDTGHCLFMLPRNFPRTFTCGTLGMTVNSPVNSHWNVLGVYRWLSQKTSELWLLRIVCQCAIPKCKHEWNTLNGSTVAQSQTSNLIYFLKYYCTQRTKSLFSYSDIIIQMDTIFRCWNRHFILFQGFTVLYLARTRVIQDLCLLLVS